jgi:hypothetical protein
VFSLTQTYIGFKIFQRSYTTAIKEIDVKGAEFHGKYYYKLKDKFKELKSI